MLVTRRPSPSPVTSLVLAGACWGSSYAVVGLLPGTNPVLLTGVRFAVFGLLSLVLLRRLGGGVDIPWGTAVLHAVGGSVGLYLSEVAAISLAGAGPTIAVVGSIPVVYAIVGARRDRSPLRALAPSISVTLLAHVVIHSSAGSATGRPLTSVLAGLAIAALGVAGFCAYATHATDHLRGRRDLTPQRWASAVGVACGLCSLPLLLVGLLYGGVGDPVRLAGAALFLALLPSWMATALWNRAVIDVPRALAGQLLVVEPLSAFVFVHLVDGSLPGPTLVTGELLLLSGALLAVRGADRITQPVGD